MYPGLGLGFNFYHIYLTGRSSYELQSARISILMFTIEVTRAPRIALPEICFIHMNLHTTTKKRIWSGRNIRTVAQQVIFEASLGCIRDVGRLL